MKHLIRSIGKLRHGATSIHAITMAGCLLTAIPAFAQNQDAARALNLFQQLLQPQKQNVAPALVPVNPGLPVNPALPVKNATATGKTKKP